MFHFPPLTRQLPHTLPALALRIARKRSTVAPCSAPQLNTVFARERNFHSHIGKAEAFKQESHKTYRNRHGEEIVFDPCDPPPGYVFVPSGNTFITRRCRKLGQKLYAVYRHKTRKRLAAQIGLYVPRDVFEKAESDFKAKRAKIEEILWRDLDKSYPLIPFADKNKLHRLISLQYPKLTGKSALDHSGITIYAYVRDRYTPFKSLTSHDENRDTEAITRAHQRVQEIIAF